MQCNVIMQAIYRDFLFVSKVPKWCWKAVRNTKATALILSHSINHISSINTKSFPEWLVGWLWTHTLCFPLEGSCYAKGSYILLQKYLSVKNKKYNWHNIILFDSRAVLVLTTNLFVSEKWRKKVYFRISSKSWPKPWMKLNRPPKTPVNCWI